MYLTPVFASILASIFLAESLGLFHIIGGALILAGLLLATQTRRGTNYPLSKQQAEGNTHG
jgi:drug/metabolite transporter (DMT)-like permease